MQELGEEFTNDWLLPNTVTEFGENPFERTFRNIKAIKGYFNRYQGLYTNIQ